MLHGGPSLNPGGRPSFARELRELAQEPSRRGVKATEAIVDDISKPAQVRLRAWELLASYAAGLPVRTVAGDVESPLIPNAAHVERGKSMLERLAASLKPRTR